MKSKFRFLHPATLFFLLTVVVAMVSWIGSIYGLGEVQSLLSPEALRWELRHGMEQYLRTPALGMVISGFLGFGIAVHAGMFDTLERWVKRGKSLSGKERRALFLAGFIGLLYVLLVGAATFAPWTIFRSVTGSLINSPFHQGFIFLLSLGIGLMGAGFGGASGRFRNDSDLIQGMSCLFARFSEYFVVLFFIVQFFSSLLYTRLAESVGIDTSLVVYVFRACTWLPLLWLWKKKMWINS